MTEEIAVGVLSLICAGAVAGFASGLFGIGGGVILVPTFLVLFPRFGASHDVVMHSAVGTCLALAVPASASSARKHRMLGNIDGAMLRSWLPWVALGTVVGAATIEFLHTRDLKIIFTLYMCATVIYVATRSASESDHGGPPPAIAQALGGTVIANLSVWLGLGGGTFTVPYLRAFHYPMKKAIAISSASGVLIGLGGALGAIVHGWGGDGRAPFSLGYVNGLAFLVVAPLMLLLAPLGARAATRAPDRVLKWIYVALLAAIAIDMAYMTFG